MKQVVCLMITVVLSVAFASPTNASLQAWLQQDAGGWVNVIDVASGGFATHNNAFGDFDVYLGVISNSGNEINQAELGLSALHVENTGNSTATLHLLFGDNGYSSQNLAAGTVLDSGMGGDQVIGQTNSLSFHTGVDFGNSNDATDTITSADISSGMLWPSLATSSFSADNSVVGATGGASFSMAGLISVTLDAGEKITFDGSANAFSTPEPASLAVWGMGFCLVGFVAGRRRR